MCIQHDIAPLGDKEVIFRTGVIDGALEFLLSALEEAGFIPNRSKFKYLR